MHNLQTKICDSPTTKKNSSIENKKQNPMKTMQKKLQQQHLCLFKSQITKSDLRSHVTKNYGWEVFKVIVWTGWSPSKLMVPKTIYCLVVLLFIKRFLRGSLDVVISLLLIMRKSLGICIMFIVLFLNGGKWCKLWSMGTVWPQRSIDLEDKYLG